MFFERAVDYTWRVGEGFRNETFDFRIAEILGVLRSILACKLKKFKASHFFQNGETRFDFNFNMYLYIYIIINFYFIFFCIFYEIKRIIPEKKSHGDQLNDEKNNKR